MSEHKIPQPLDNIGKFFYSYKNNGIKNYQIHSTNHMPYIYTASRLTCIMFNRWFLYMHGEIIIEFVMAELLQISCPPPPSGHPQSLSSEHPQRNRSEFLNLIIIFYYSCKSK